jgi:hypothetical protein
MLDRPEAPSLFPEMSKENERRTGVALCAETPSHPCAPPQSAGYATHSRRASDATRSLDETEPLCCLRQAESEDTIDEQRLRTGWVARPQMLRSRYSRAAFPGMSYRQIVAGEPLPFPDNSFDIATSNAVLEHVGSVANQRGFISELTRVASRGFITVPNRFFPVEHHTGIPFLQRTAAGFGLAMHSHRKGGLGPTREPNPVVPSAITGRMSSECRGHDGNDRHSTRTIQFQSLPLLG